MRAECSAQTTMIALTIIALVIAIALGIFTWIVYDTANIYQQDRNNPPMKFFMETYKKIQNERKSTILPR